jgi:outer membrane protein assembly factor BamB
MFSLRSDKLVILCAVALLALVAPALDHAEEPAWPQANGPFGNFNPRQYGRAIVDDLADAKTAWVSEDKDLGFGKGSSSGYVRHLADPTTHPGTASGLIVAEGRVFASSFRPNGEVWAEKHPTIGVSIAEGKWTGKQAEAVKRNSAYEADDLTVAIDLESGKTAWKAVEAKQGINRYSGKRNHFGVTPAYHAGKIFSFGTTGIVYCYDATTGTKLWQNADGPLAKEAPALKAKLLADRKDMPGGGAMSASLVVADGVLIVPQYRAASPHDIGLRGLAIDDGRELWTLPAATCRYATPAVWAHGERQYVLAATTGEHWKRPDSGALRLVDPQTGKVLWTVDELAPTYYPLAPSDKHVLVNVPSAVKSPKKNAMWGLMAAYRLSPEKAELAWTMPDKPQFWFENHMDICAMRRVLVRDGRVYFYGQGHTLDPAKSAFSLCILEEETGKPLYISPEGEFGHYPSAGIIGQAWLVEDRLLNIRDAAHSERAELDLIALDPANVRRLCRPWKPPHEKTTTAYEVFLELPYVDGRFLMRAQDGSVRCYDLRKAQSASSP